ncbi:hypothetical protein Hdeb2414_s0007g00252261 [Helianthus debilis subsp. tardiflorus]
MVITIDKNRSKGVCEEWYRSTMRQNRATVSTCGHPHYLQYKANLMYKIVILPRV